MRLGYKYLTAKDAKFLGITCVTQQFSKIDLSRVGQLLDIGNRLRDRLRPDQ